MKNFVQPGLSVPLPMPYDRTSGQGVLVGALFGVVAVDALTGVTAEVAVSGVFDITKEAPLVIAVGARVFWDNTNKRVTTTAAGIIDRFGSMDAITTVLDGIREQCVLAGLGDPYIIMMDGWHVHAAKLAGYGADAASAYVAFGQIAAPTPYVSLMATAEQWRIDAAAVGVHVVPPLTFGWDYRPRNGGGSARCGAGRAGVQLRLEFVAEMAGSMVAGRNLPPGWYFHPADVLGKWATGVEAAAGGHVGGAGDLADQALRLAAAIRVEGRDRREKRTGIGMARLGEQHARRRRLDDGAQIHHRHHVADMRHHAEIVTDEQDGQAQFVTQRLQQVQDVGLDGNVQGRHALVGHHEARTGNQGAGDGDALALPPREGMRVAAQMLQVEPAAGRHLAHPCVGFLA